MVIVGGTEQSFQGQFCGRKVVGIGGEVGGEVGSSGTSSSSSGATRGSSNDRHNGSGGGSCSSIGRSGSSSSGGERNHSMHIIHRKFRAQSGLTPPGHHIHPPTGLVIQRGRVMF